MAARSVRRAAGALPRRSSHEATVLTLLRDHGPLSRARLSEITGLSPTTITKAVAPLIDEGLLGERVDPAGRVGRPSITLTPIPGAVSVCGVQIGVGTLKFGMADAKGSVRDVSSERFDPRLPAEDVLALIGDSVERLLDRVGRDRCIGIGVGAPGPVDIDRRRVRLSVNLRWSDVPVADTLERRLGIPVVVDHNVRSMALAEIRYGGHPVDSLAYLYVKHGVGLGVAVRGGPFYGGSGGESYIGHTRVVEDGPPCSCGARGCLDTQVSEPSLIRAMQAFTEHDDQAAIMADVLAALERLAGSGNEEAVALRHRFVDLLAGALATVTNLFTPSLVLIGGILARAPEPMVAELAQRTGDRIFPLLREGFRIERADGSDSAAVRGAAAAALEVLHYSGR